MTDAEFSARIVDLLEESGPRKFMMLAMQEARFALTDYGFESWTQAKPSCSNEHQWLVQTIRPGVRLRLTVEMFDPGRGHVMEIHAHLFAHSAKTSRGRVHSWLEAVAPACSFKTQVLASQKVFLCRAASPPQLDSELAVLLRGRLEGKRPLGEEHDLPSRAAAFATKVDAVLSS